MDQAVAVGEVVYAIRELLRREVDLQDVWVRGEISGFNHHSSGHMYLDLKDDAATLPCVFFRRENERLTFRPEHGQRVLARGRVDVYVQRGAVQLYVQEMRQDGDGDLHARLEALKQRLAAEGLFDETLKRPIPAMPTRIGIVTSREAAALHDMLHVLDERAPYAQVLLRAARVQGEGAGAAVAAAIRRLNAVPSAERPEVILVARGGGSLEDLSAFNDEEVVRAIVQSTVPVVCGVGHETDVTLADLAADRRAPTPTAAARAVAPGAEEAAWSIEEKEERLTRAMTSRLGRARERLAALTERGPLTSPSRLLAPWAQQVDDLAGRLNALSPLATMGRGYAVALQRDGSVLRSVADTKAGEELDVRVTDGAVRTVVRSVEEKGSDAT